MADERRRAGRLETVGAWLRIWTPPRHVDVPPVPWRSLVLIGVPLLAFVTAGVWLVVRDASETKQEREAVAARDAAERRATERARLETEQALRTKRVGPADRPALVSALERAVFADARARVRRGKLEHQVERVECGPHPRTAMRRAAELDPSRRSGRYYCVAVTRDLAGTRAGSLGYPFLGRITYASGRLAWCKINPVPGERAVPHPREVPQLPSGCR